MVTPKAPKDRYTLELPHGLRELAHQMAAAEGRSLNNWVTQALLRAVQQWQAQKATDDNH